MEEAQSFGRSSKAVATAVQSKSRGKLSEKGRTRWGRLEDWQKGRRNEAGRLLDFDTGQECRSDSWRLADQARACTGFTVKNLAIHKTRSPVIVCP